MNYDLTVLRAVVRLSRKGKEADLEALNIRCGGELADVRGALRRLEASGLVARTVSGGSEGARLTLQGLAVGVAVARSPRRSTHGKHVSPAAPSHARIGAVAPARRAAA